MSPSFRRAEPGTGKPHECPACGRRLADKRSLKQHAAAAHRDGVSPRHANVEAITPEPR